MELYVEKIKKGSWNFLEESHRRWQITIENKYEYL